MKSRHWVCIFFLWVFWSQLPSLHAAEKNDEEIVWIEGRYFDIIGVDNRSVSFADVLGTHVAETCIRYLKVGSHDFPKRILVTLRPPGRASFEGDYRIKAGPRGQVSLDFRWDDSLSFEMTCRAFTEAYLLNYARFNYGVYAYKHIRFWAFSAVSTRVYLSLRPAQKTAYIKESRQSGVSEIETLLSLYLKEATGKKLAFHQGYWVFQILRENGLQNSQITALIDRAIAGEDLTGEIAELLFNEREKQTHTDFEEWWQSQVGSYLAREQAFCDHLTTSRLWLEELSNFETQGENGEPLKSLMDLWKYRHDETLRSVLSARCEIIRLRIGQVNPAYFNVALSLGALYETVLEAEHKHEFIRAFTVYLKDRDDTKQLHARLDELLSECN